MLGVCSGMCVSRVCSGVCVSRGCSRECVIPEGALEGDWAHSMPRWLMRSPLSRGHSPLPFTLRGREEEEGTGVGVCWYGTLCAAVLLCGHGPRISDLHHLLSVQGTSLEICQVALQSTAFTASRKVECAIDNYFEITSCCDVLLQVAIPTRHWRPDILYYISPKFSPYVVHVFTKK